MLDNQIARIKAALNAVSLPDAKTMGETAQEWVELFCYPESDNDNIQPLELSLAVPTGAVTVIARNDRPVLAKQLAKLMAANQYPEVETKLLQLGFKELPTAFLSCEVEMTGKERDVRWAASDVLPIDAAFKLIPDGPMEAKLKEWYEEADSNACLSIGRSVGGGYTSWETELPGDTVRFAMSAYSYLCRQLEVEPLPDPVADAIDAANPEEMTTFGRFTKNGATKMGLIIRNPSDQIIEIARLSGANGAKKVLDAIATFEGSLGKANPDKVAFSMSARGWEVEFFYNL